jgi:hypothetical protein
MVNDSNNIEEDIEFIKNFGQKLKTLVIQRIL